MNTVSGHRAAAGRAEMALVGAVSGAAIWALFDHAPDVVTHPLAYLFLVSFVSGFLAVLLGVSGPHRVARAAAPAFWLALVAAALLTWSGQRFETLDALVEARHPIVAWIVFLLVGTPFAASRLRDHHSLWDYVHLFDVGWSLLVRYSAGWLFAGLFWLVVMLSDALLQIVGLTTIDDFLEVDGVRYVITGAALGLGLSVVHEMRDYLSPFLVLRLLRLLVPVMLVVVVVFVAAALMQEPGALFGTLSEATTLLIVALLMIALVSIALDRGDGDAVQIGWMRLATAALALLLPVLAGLASYAVWLRVSDYGWTPERLAAACATGVVAAYAVSYALCVIAGRGWMARIRKTNIAMAVLVLCVAAAWMSPMLNAERLSTRSQVTRILSGTVAQDEAALWQMAQDWGHAGQEGLVRLEQDLTDDAAAWQQAIETAREGGRGWRAAVLSSQEDITHLAARFLESVTVISEARQVSADMFVQWPRFSMETWAALCDGSAAPGCVIMLGELQDAYEGAEGFFFLPSQGETYRVLAVFERRGLLIVGDDVEAVGDKEVTRAHVERIVNGLFEIAPSSQKSLWIGDVEVAPNF